MQLTKALRQGIGLKSFKPRSTAVMFASTGVDAAGCQVGAVAAVSLSTVSMTGLSCTVPDTRRPVRSRRSALNSFSLSPVRSTTGCSIWIETLSGEIGRPCTLVCARRQLAVMVGACPGSAIVSGPTNSVVSTVGYQTWADTIMSRALSESRGWVDVSSAPGSTQRISMPNGKPLIVCVAQV